METYKQKNHKTRYPYLIRHPQPPILAHSIYPKRQSDLVIKLNHKDHIILLFSDNPDQIAAFYALVPDTQELDLKGEHFKPIPRIKSTQPLSPQNQPPTTPLRLYGIETSDTLNLSKPICPSRPWNHLFINGKPYPHDGDRTFLGH